MSDNRSNPMVSFVARAGTGADFLSSSDSTAQAALLSVQASSARPRPTALTAAPSERSPRSITSAVPIRDPRQPLTVQKTRPTHGQHAAIRQPLQTRIAPDGAPSLFRRATGAIGAVSRVVTQALHLGPANPIIGLTPATVISEAKDVFENNYFKHHTFRDEQVFLGSGGEIYVARNKNKPEVFVVKHTKVMPWSNTKDMPFEAHLLLNQLLPHERIVAVYESLPDLKQGNEGRHRIWMEYCNAGTLFDQHNHWISRVKKAMPEVFLLQVLVQGMEALAFIHHGLRHAGQGKFTQDRDHDAIIHGDLKEENILLSWTFQPLPQLKLADFGAAKLASVSDDRRIMPGTLCYHAPEDVAVYGDLTACLANAAVFEEMINRRTIASDVYAFGLTMYMFATKERHTMKIGTDPSTLHISRKYETPGLLEIIRKMLAVDPAERAVASFREKHGVMAQINEMRDARDRMIGARQLPGSAEWVVSPPKGHHLR